MGEGVGIGRHGHQWDALCSEPNKITPICHQYFFLFTCCSSYSVLNRDTFVLHVEIGVYLSLMGIIKCATSKHNISFPPLNTLGVQSFPG